MAGRRGSPQPYPARPPPHTTFCGRFAQPQLQIQVPDEDDVDVPVLGREEGVELAGVGTSGPHGLVETAAWVV